MNHKISAKPFQYPMKRCSYCLHASDWGLWFHATIFWLSLFMSQDHKGCSITFIFTDKYASLHCFLFVCFLLQDKSSEQWQILKAFGSGGSVVWLSESNLDSISLDSRELGRWVWNDFGSRHQLHRFISVID